VTEFFLPDPNQLLRCPFCGNRASFKLDPGSWGYRPQTIAAQCQRCGFSLPAREYEQAKYPDGRHGVEVRDTLKPAHDAVVEAWNRRP
jgi:hypothetical protein